MGILHRRYRQITEKQIIDFAQVTVLLLCLASLVFDIMYLNIIIGIMCLISILLPVFIKPLAVAWYLLSEVLGTINATIILLIIFLLLVTPVSLIRKVLGKDSLKLNQFKRDGSSMFISRNHLYEPEDMRNTY